MAETLFAFSNDDAGIQEPELFADLLDFLDEEQVPATFSLCPMRKTDRWTRSRNGWD